MNYSIKGGIEIGPISHRYENKKKLLSINLHVSFYFITLLKLSSNYHNNNEIIVEINLK